jgi:hypothetical protein
LGKVITAPRKLTLEEVKTAIGFAQPKLCARVDGDRILVQGSYLVFENGSIANPAGPISTFDVEMMVPDRYPDVEPKVLEVGGRIPRLPDRHINPDGDCCVTVWEHWLACANDHSYAAFLNGPLNEFFLGQYSYETTGKWPFGERPHGLDGLEEAYADALGIRNKKKDIIYHLRLLSLDWPKGHWLCPCGSGIRLRHCHRDDLVALHEKVPPRLAKRMLRRLKAEMA